MSRRRVGLAAPYGVVVVVVLLAPLAVLALYSLWTAGFFDVEKTFTASNYRDVLSGSLYPHVLERTMALAALSAVLCVGAALVLAYAIVFRMPRRGTAVLVFTAATLFVSYLVRVYAWGTILGTGGIVNRTLTGLGIVHAPLGFLFYGRFAIVVTLVYVYLPVAVLVLYGGLTRVDPRTLEASRDMGGGRVATLVRVVVPQASGSIRSAFALVFVLCATDYVTPTLVGGAKGQMVGSVIRDQFGGAANLPLGSALAFVTMAAIVVTLLVAALAGRLALRVLAGIRLPGHRLRGRVLAHRSLSRPLACLVLAFLVAPVLVVIVFSLNDSSVPGLPMRGLSLHWYGEIVRRAGFGAALRTSVEIMGIAVAGALALGVPVAFLLARAAGRSAGAVQAMVYAPVAVPGVVFGVGILVAATYVDLQLGVLITAAAHTVLLVPYVVVVVRARLAALDARLGDAARDLGASSRQVLRTVTLPLIGPSLLGAGLLAAAVSLDELLVTNFTIGAGANLPVWVFGQIRRGLTPGINALAVMIFVVTMVVVTAAAALMSARGAGLRRTLGAAR